MRGTTSGTNPGPLLGYRPKISFDHQQAILDLLCKYVLSKYGERKLVEPHLTKCFCSLVAPIGHYRSQCVKPSRGKRIKKRKRERTACQVKYAEDCPGMIEMTRPKINDFLTIGFNSTTRHLEAMVKTASIDASVKPKPLIAVFVCPDGKPPILYSHLPLLCKSASKSYPQSQETRLVSLSQAAEHHLKSALGIHQVSLIGVKEGASGSESLAEYIRNQVAPLDIPWLEVSSRGIFLPTEIKAVQTTTLPKQGAKNMA